MLTDLYEKMLPLTSESMDKVGMTFSHHIQSANAFLDESDKQKCRICRYVPISSIQIYKILNRKPGEFCWGKFPLVYAKAINLGRKLTETYNEALTKYDVLVMPTTITASDPLPLESDSAVTKMSKTIGKLDNTCPFNAT